MRSRSPVAKGVDAPRSTTTAADRAAYVRPGAASSDGLLDRRRHQQAGERLHVRRAVVGR